MRVPCNYRLGLGIIGADSGRVIIGSLLLPGEPHHDDDDDDGVYLKAVNTNLRANLQMIKSVNLKYL